MPLTQEVALRLTHEQSVCAALGASEQHEAFYLDGLNESRGDQEEAEERDRRYFDCREVDRSLCLVGVRE
jgi:hypothetical protein